MYTTGRQLATGTFKSVAATLMKHQGMRDALYGEACDGVNKEIQDLCCIGEPSLLRATSAEDLACLTWEKINNELKDRAPRFHQFLKKVGFQRLSSLYHSMGYKATNTMFEKFGKDFDKDLKVWKETVEKDSKKERSLIEKEMKNTLKPKLSCRTIGMHPGYSFTGDNVDIRCKPRQMTVKNRNKDHHMFQLVAFQNRVSANHLPNDAPKSDVMKEPFTTFLPSVDEQAQLVEELVILVGQKWALIIPALAWFQ